MIAGAYYGLAVSFVLSKQYSKHEVNTPKSQGTYVTDTFAMIGTLFIFVLWPSFNGALASAPHISHSGATGECGGDEVIGS
jgi:ammonium transporter Rh